MTHDERAIWIKRSLLTALYLASFVGIVSYFKTGDGPAPVSLAKEKRNPVTSIGERIGHAIQEGIQSIWPEQKKEVKPHVTPGPAAPHPGTRLLIYHHHLPGDPTSDQVTDLLHQVQKRYGPMVEVTRIDFLKQREISQAQKITRPPHVVMMVGTEKLYEFQGLLPEPQLNRKVEELLAGLQRVGKDWRPPVPGMRRL